MVQLWQWTDWSIAVAVPSDMIARHFEAGISPMAILKLTVPVLFFSCCLAISAAAQDGKKINAAKEAISAAKACDGDAALAFAQLAGETADAVASASFDKCRDLWNDAHRKYDDAGSGPVPYSDAQLKQNPYLVSAWMGSLARDAEANSMDQWKRAEIDRLRVVVMEVRLKNAPKQ
jgi:hypothetical protein